VDALTRAGRVDTSRLDEARIMFESMLGYANHLGLFAEETSMLGEALGNFPQAFTHLALISAAFNLDRALDAQ
jgi:GH15 family glucan-1,4-alpha-glucosidase